MHYFYKKYIFPYERFWYENIKFQSEKSEREPILYEMHKFFRIHEYNKFYSDMILFIFPEM